MKNSRIFLLFTILLAAVSCGTVEDTTGGPATKISRGADVLLKSSLARRPSWADSNGTIKGGGEMMFVGRASGIRNEIDSVKMATNDAFSQLSSYFGVSVKSDLISSEQETDGRYTYNIGLESKLTGAKITVKDYKIAGVYTEQWQRNSREFDSFVLLAIPDIEIARIRIESEGMCLCVVISADNEAVKRRAKETIQKISKKKGIKFKQDIHFTTAESSEYRSIEKVQTAYVLSVKCQIGKTNEYSGEYYTTVDTDIELVSLIEGKVLESWSAEAKGGAFSKDDSIVNGIEESFKMIINKI
ncbi:MAG TPA: hypothetical protein PLZ43_09680 [bacterium]|nr:hypothetical protein [bacterium]